MSQWKLSGAGWVHQGDSHHRHGKVWVAGVITGPEGELVGGPANDNRFEPTFDQAILWRGRRALA